MSNAQRRAFEAIAETCPELEDILEHVEENITSLVTSEVCNAVERIKRSITEPFRSALIDAYSEADDQERRADDAEQQVEKLQDEIRDLQSDIERLERERDEAVRGY